MKNNNAVISLLICMMAFFCNQPAGATFDITHYREIKFDHISIEDGLSQSTILCILQDNKGFMWFGTHDGINKYDGNKITLYKNDTNDPDSLCNMTVRSIYEDSAGILWIGTQNGLDKFDREKEIFIHYRHDPTKTNSLSNDFVDTVYEDSSGTLWVGTQGGGLNKLHRETGTFTCYKDNPGGSFDLGSDNVFCINEDHNGVLWIGTDNGLQKFDHKTGKFIHYRNVPLNPRSLSNNIVNSICSTQANPQVLWVGTCGGLNKLDMKTDTFTCHKNDPKNPDSLSGDIILSLCEDQSGALWIGTCRDGLNIFDPLKARFTRFYLDPKNPYSLSHNEITSLYEDRSGVMWIGTEGAGLNIFSRSKNIFTHYRNDPYLPNTLSYNLVWCFLEERPGILWIGTAKGLNRFDRENYKFSYYFTDPKNVHSLSNNSVRCIYRDRSGIFWLGTADVGLNKFDPQTGIFTRYRCLQKSPKELLNNIVRSIAGDKMGLLWIGTSNGLYSFDTKKESFTNTYYTHDPNNPKSISDNLILYLCEDDTGALWIATQWGGLNKFNPETKSFAHYMNSPNSYNCLSSNVIICIYQAKSGTLWIGTGGGGLNKFHRETGTFTHYTTKNGLPNDTVYGILEDDQENLWLSTNKGLSCFNPVSEIFKNYNVKDGIQGYEFNSGAFYKSSSGEMFFGGQNGFNSFYPDRIEDNKHVPHLVITNLKLSNKTVDFKSNPLLKKHISYTDEITLSYRDNIFTIYFAALEFTNPAKNQYKYMMEGLHKNWINLGHQNNISFTGLEPGKYIFRVTGSNNDGIWNQTGTSLKIIITPPFWKTWWFRAICIVAILMLFFAWHKQRMANLSLQLKSEAEMERLFEKHNISSREREIIHLILKGKTNKDIEDVLYISVRTVKNHIYNIYQKFGVNSRLELIHEIQKSVKSN